MKTLDARGNRQLSRSAALAHVAACQTADCSVLAFNRLAFRQFKHFKDTLFSFSNCKEEKKTPWRENDCGSESKLKEEKRSMYSHHNYKYISQLELGTMKRWNKNATRKTKFTPEKKTIICMHASDEHAQSTDDATTDVRSVQTNDDTHRPRSLHNFFSSSYNANWWRMEYLFSSFRARAAFFCLLPFFSNIIP